MILLFGFTNNSRAQDVCVLCSGFLKFDFKKHRKDHVLSCRLHSPALASLTPTPSTHVTCLESEGLGFAIPNIT